MTDPIPPNPNPFESPGILPPDKRLIELPPIGPRQGSLVGVAIAWFIIVALGLFMFGSQFLPDTSRESTSKMVETQNANMVGKLCVGVANMPGGTVEQALDQTNALNSGSLENRYCYVLLQNEFSGATKALDRLEKVDELQIKLDYEATDSQKRIRNLIGKLLRDYEAEEWNAPSLSEADKSYLRDSLGYVGNLSLLPSQGNTSFERDRIVQKSIWTTVILVVGLVLGMGAFLIGFIMFGSMLIMSYAGLLRSHFVSDTTRGRIYAETFAFWFVCFLGLQFIFAIGLGLTGIKPGAHMTAGFGLILFFGSLVALCWPIFRGISFSNICSDIGWTCKNPFKEVFLGAVAYVANLPVMAIGFGGFAGLNMLSDSFKKRHELESVEQVTHPIMEQIASGDVMLIVLVALTACVAAPIVEETVFRGVLYRHLRETSLKWARILSVIFATLINSFIFAAIHPQGWTAIPVLGALAVGFSWAREWRGSLIAPMTMHAINNGIVTALMLLMLL